MYFVVVVMRRVNVFETPRGRQSWDRAMCLISQSQPVKKSYQSSLKLAGLVLIVVFLGVLLYPDAGTFIHFE